jgi:hypothetical protein
MLITSGSEILQVTPKTTKNNRASIRNTNDVPGIGPDADCLQKNEVAKLR